MRRERFHCGRAVIGPLGGSLLLHGAGLVLGATLGMRAIDTAIEARVQPVDRPILLESAPNADPAPLLAEPPRERAEPELPVFEVAAFDVEVEVLDIPLAPLSDEWSKLPSLEPLEEATRAADDPRPSDWLAFEPGSAALAGKRIPGAAHPGGSASGSIGSGGPGGAVPGGPSTGPVGSGSGRGVGLGDAAAAASFASAPREPVVREPKALTALPPEYPKLSRREGEEGSVLCELYVTDEGGVARVEVVESSGFSRLDEAARAMLLTWRFEARTVDGRAVTAKLRHRVTFRLDG